MNQDNIACNGRSGGRGKEGVWLERCITGLVGELKEERQLFLRKVIALIVTMIIFLGVSKIRSKQNREHTIVRITQIFHAQ